jgi:hypothetical protein
VSCAKGNMPLWSRLGRDCDVHGPCTACHAVARILLSPLQLDYKSNCSAYGIDEGDVVDLALGTRYHPEGIESAQVAGAQPACCIVFSLAGIHKVRLVLPASPSQRTGTCLCIYAYCHGHGAFRGILLLYYYISNRGGDTASCPFDCDCLFLDSV